jgi:hypothetical protein
VMNGKGGVNLSNNGNFPRMVMHVNVRQGAKALREDLGEIRLDRHRKNTFFTIERSS